MGYAWVALAAVLAISPRAFAGRCDWPKTPEQEALLDADDALHSESGVGLRAGDYRGGAVEDAALGFAADSGVRLDRVAVFGEYEFLGLDDWRYSHDPTGHVQRIGANARYSFGRIHEARNGTLCRLEAYVEAGAGEQLVALHGEGDVYRTDFSFGAGYGVQTRGRRFHGGYTVGVRAMWAQGRTVLLDVQFVFGG